MKTLLFSLLTLAVIVNTHAQRLYKVGDTAFCGIIFFVETDSGRQHGLVCAFQDQSAAIAWYNGNYKTTYAVQDHLFAKGNADTIINQQGNDSIYAATICNNYLPDSTGSCTNWYLPSKTELYLMYLNLAKNGKGNFAYEGYWSSLEWSPDLSAFLPNEERAWIVDFFNGSLYPENKANKYRARAIRKF